MYDMIQIDQHYSNLRRRQKEHIDTIQDNIRIDFTPCAHDGCQQCHGTGIQVDGSPCVHHISCGCPKCNPR